MTISTRNLEQLPDIDVLRRAVQSVAVLDAILSPDWEYRYFSFNSECDEGEHMGSMRNGSGNEVFALFSKHGCFIAGFDHESVMSPQTNGFGSVWPGVLDNVPSEFESGLNEPAFSMQHTTFCVWRRIRDKAWHCGSIEFPKGDDPDGSAQLLAGFDGKPATYCEFAEEYYETTVPLAAVQHVFGHKPLTDAVVKTLNADLSIGDIAGELAEIGYP